MKDISNIKQEISEVIQKTLLHDKYNFVIDFNNTIRRNIEDVFSRHGIDFPLYSISRKNFKEKFIPSDNTYWLNIENRCFLGPRLGREVEIVRDKTEFKTIYVNNDEDVKQFWFDIIKDI